jgi:glycosyltransferase involved in cell wall biosynthesis
MVTITAIATKRINDPMPTNVQHLMGRLSAFFRINYIEPPVDIIFLLKNFKFINRFFRKTKWKQIRKYIPIILPFENRFIKIRKINEKILLIQIRIFLKFNNSNKNILWIFSPKHSFLAGKLNESKLYFHITDDYLAFPEKAGLGPVDMVKSQEKYLMQRADRIFVTSAYLKKLKKLFFEKIELIPNVADYKHFIKVQTNSTKIPDDIALIQKPIIGFVGAIDYFKVDFEVIEHCAQQNPSFSFVMIGPIGHGDNTNRSKLPSGENVHYFGKKPYELLPNYIKAFDACIIPYRLSTYTQACSPLKLHEYLAAGKPVVSTNLPAVEDFRHHVYIGSGPHDFCRLIKKALKEDRYELIKDRQRLADENSWDKRMMLINRIILKDLEP